MAVKTITIDIEAYNLLSRQKQAGQSFSQVIKAHFGDQPTASRFRALARSLRISGDALDAMASQVRERAKTRARAIPR
ncbi:MAG TPA: antitoxin VapB family protein [Vicinamibacterales bacterium]